ncbi:hypothetical protein HUJ04_002712 [Dendroctonus ponderosae]|nr:hypothetical protein HUJ04_002712 [Dendroctonus ponderosae]
MSTWAKNQPPSDKSQKLLETSLKNPAKGAAALGSRNIFGSVQCKAGYEFGELKISEDPEYIEIEQKKKFYKANFVTYEQFSRENRVHNHNTLPANILKAKQNCPGGSMQLFPGVCKPIFKLNPEVKCNCRETPAKASETMKKAQVWLVVLLLGILLLDYVHCTFMNYTSFLKADETKQGHLFYSQNCAECYLYKAGRCIRIFGCKDASTKERPQNKKLVSTFLINLRKDHTLLVICSYRGLKNLQFMCRLQTIFRKLEA